LMQDGCSYTREVAALAAGQLGVHASEALQRGLLALMQDEVIDVSQAAARSLALTVRGLQLLCAQEFPDAPTAIAASRIIEVPAAEIFTEKSWHMDFQTKKTVLLAPGEAYKVVEASAKDIEKVIGFYQGHPVPGYEVGAVQVVYNPNFNRNFQGKLQDLQHRHGNKAFDPSWQQENEPEWRAKTYQKLERLAAPYQDKDYPNVKIVPVWHGTSREYLDSIFKTGFANLAKVDAGFYGKGIYGAHEAVYSHQEYALKYHGDKAILLLNWVAIYSAYPVIHGDMQKFIMTDPITKKEVATGSYGNYDTHFIPVAPYHPCSVNQEHINTEVVTFEEAACLPRYVVELQKTLLISPKALCLCQSSLPQNQLAVSTSAIAAESSVDTRKTDKGKKR